MRIKTKEKFNSAIFNMFAIVSYKSESLYPRSSQRSASKTAMSQFIYSHTIKNLHLIRKQHS